jgi:hypothetical protein
MRYLAARLVPLCFVALATASNAADPPPLDGSKTASVVSKATVQARVHIVDMVKVESGRGTGMGPVPRQIKRKIDCGKGPQDTLELCEETLFEVE